jgi:hypothetical protein
MPVASYQTRLKKMSTTLKEVVEYGLDVGEETLALNNYIGTEIEIKFDGKIHCVFCGKMMNKSYAGGSCYQCMQTLPQNDMCQMKPELCHFKRGTCRDSEWGEKHCFTPHKVYLARSSGIKVGITREIPTETRWMDQGAVEGMVIAEVPDRHTSGLVETAIAQHIQDKTDFRKMLRGEISEEDLMEVYENIVDSVPMQYQQHLLADLTSVVIKYPLGKHPEKIKPLSLDKQSEIKAKLEGIKGQYLIFEDFVFNMRAHSGYEVTFQGAPTGGFDASKQPEDEEPMNLFDLMG